MGIQYLTNGLIATIQEHTELEEYRIYHTNCLYLLCCALNNNPGVRYVDIIHPVEEDQRSCNDIVLERLSRFGIEVIG